MINNSLPPASTADTFGRLMRDLRISVTDKCNYRCTYCMPEATYHDSYAFLSRQDLLSFEEITRIASVLVQSGVRKLRITGGEPLLRRELDTLIGQLHGITGVEDLALTTNAVLLPGLAGALRNAGLHRITVSLDSLDDTSFRSISGNRGDVGQVLKGIAAAEAAGFASLKINAVIVRGINDDQVLPLARYFRGSRHILRFIEYMDVGTCNGWRASQVVTSKEIYDRIHAEFPLLPLQANYRGEVARRYRYADDQGEIGFISSVTEPFCGDCGRLRLSAEGKLYTCLFASDGFDLRTPLRAGATNDELGSMIKSLWQSRSDRYSELRQADGSSAMNTPKVEMYHIGG